MAKYIHTTPKYKNSNRRSGREFTRAVAGNHPRLRTRNRDSAKFKTAERVYSGAWPAFGGSLGVLYTAHPPSDPNIRIYKMARNPAVGSDGMTNLVKRY